ncbi:hypothetical protein O0235_10730 [Tepidiforma flava]|uniref:Uncharacterized protein n=1 Tax=Tepidiforma flava TaxID=3004094 RepID=A0ABY7M5H4_9CHLR|nr:hypothetical protein [Tepidiforma flava]WBL35260.1 hypothetical protein O0235_10730 [Tepidiforma flava]
MVPSTEAAQEALADVGGFLFDGFEEGIERFVVEPGEEGLARRGEEVAVAGPAGAAAQGFVGDDALRLERLEMLAGGADGEEAVGGDLFGGRAAEAAEGDEERAAGRVEKVEAGRRGHGCGSVREVEAIVEASTAA